MLKEEEKDKFITVKHLANAGDIIAVLAGLKEIHRKYGKKIIFYQWLNVQAQYYQGASHPILDSNGNMVCMNKTTFDMMKPLMLAQDYIEDFREWQGEKVHVDLDIIRNKLFVNMPFGMIQSWIMMAYPDMACDLSKSWLNVSASDKYKDKIIINFTERYRNTMISYFFLKEHQQDLVFTGTEKEYKAFCELWSIDVPRIELTNFLELAEYIKGCRFFMGNQSSGWNMANAMGVPRIVEMCQFAPNCQPFVGEYNYGFYHQDALQYYFNELKEKF